MGGNMRLRNKKTGEIINGGFVVCEYKDGARFSVKDKPCFDSLDELKEEWEDYKPTEPLIKDPKIRKAVRAWAEANDIEDGITYLDNGEFRSYLNTTIDFAILVDEHRFDLLKKSEEYNITELCGEEEE